ncbi:hypothetical protein VITFI_CDS1251 [Vitreoscilla filiformis]|uniref:Uncharacterized protein n=1 Tax=Vitreoscilla filiformis TaxID=63 RepID=A0A221KDI9_VITFI|nr:hypothetical protein VITFI_CDS1251 [Vitreoscilla filiformis]
MCGQSWARLVEPASELVNRWAENQPTLSLDTRFFVPPWGRQRVKTKS